MKTKAKKADTGYVHIIGICGVATSALGIAFHNKGYKVTGSDKGFFPPVSTELERAGVPFYAGWHPEKFDATASGRLPDFVIAGTASGSQNPETTFAKEHNIPIKSDAEVRGEYFAKTNSIVCAGTWGKTSSTALLSFILREAEIDPSFVIGGLSLSTESGYLGDSDWSVIEGDEYKSSPWDNRPKFDHLKTTHLLLTSVSWDHADLYPTEADYFNVFRRLVGVSKMIVACSDQPGVKMVLNDSKTEEQEIFMYGKKFDNPNTPDSQKNAYTYDEVTQNERGLRFTIEHGEASYQISSPMIGAFQAENITGCFAMAHTIGVSAENIISAIARFEGLKRRLEKRVDGSTSRNGVTVFDDIAHSPEKAAAVLANLREIYSGKISVIFEPNIGGRRLESAHKYDYAFKNADRVFIPRLTKLKVSSEESGQQVVPFDGEELATIIARTHMNTEFVENDDTLVSEIISGTQKGDCVAFLGSHGFRGMIEEVCKKLA